MDQRHTRTPSMTHSSQHGMSRRVKRPATSSGDGRHVIRADRLNPRRHRGKWSGDSIDGAREASPALPRRDSTAMAIKLTTAAVATRVIIVMDAVNKRRRPWRAADLNFVSVNCIPQSRLFHQLINTKSISSAGLFRESGGRFPRTAEAPPSDPNWKLVGRFQAFGHFDLSPTLGPISVGNSARFILMLRRICWQIFAIFRPFFPLVLKP